MTGGQIATISIVLRLGVAVRPHLAKTPKGEDRNRGRRTIELHAGEGRRTATVFTPTEDRPFEPVGWLSADIPIESSRRLQPRELVVEFRMLHQYARVGGRIEPGGDTLSFRVGHTGSLPPLVEGDLSGHTHRRHPEALPHELAIGALAGLVDASRSLPIASGSVTITHAAYDPIDSGSQAFKSASALLLWALLQDEAELDAAHLQDRFDRWLESWFMRL